MAIVTITIFLVALIVIGIILYIYRKQFFNIPDYQSPEYGVKVWYEKNNKMVGIERIDRMLDRLSIMVHKDYPGITYESLNSKYEILKVKICGDDDTGIYVSIDEFKKTFPGLTTKNVKVVDDEVFVLVSGKCLYNYLYIRKIGVDLILDTALIHEIVHFIIEAYQLVPEGDREHKVEKFWESAGWVGELLKKMR